MVSGSAAIPMQSAIRPAAREIWAWLEAVADPEVPVISVVDLGIVREVRWEAQGLVVVITPTYSGCPAMRAIEEEIRRALQRRGIDALRIETRLAPAWTTDWMSARGRQKLRGYGIVAPAQQAVDVSGISRRRHAAAVIACPHCGSGNTVLVSQFGSTACKALYKCNDCLEPFDYFKAH